MKKRDLLLAEGAMGILAFSQFLMIRDYKDSLLNAVFMIAFSAFIGVLALELVGIIVEDIVRRYRRE